MTRQFKIFSLVAILGVLIGAAGKYLLQSTWIGAIGTLLTLSLIVGALKEIKIKGDYASYKIILKEKPYLCVLVSISLWSMNYLIPVPYSLTLPSFFFLLLALIIVRSNSGGKGIFSILSRKKH